MGLKNNERGHWAPYDWCDEWACGILSDRYELRVKRHEYQDFL